MGVTTVQLLLHECDTAGCQTALNEQHCLFNRYDNRAERTDCSFNTVVKAVE